MSNSWNESNLTVIGDKIASGYFGKVWKAANEDGRIFAIKQVYIAKTLRYFAGNQVGVNYYHKLLREVENIKSIISENVVKHFDYWEEGKDISKLHESLPEFVPYNDMTDGSSTSDAVNFLFIKMEFCDFSLKTYLQKTPLQERMPQIENMFKNLAYGLAAIHAQNIIHRDLKPDNILCQKLDDDNFLWKIGDFGLSIERDPGNEMSKEISYAGTDVYWSPEMYVGVRQVPGTKYYANTDVYSLGLVFLEVFMELNYKTEKDKRDKYFNSLRSGECLIQSVFSYIPDEFIKERNLVLHMLNHDKEIRLNSKDVAAFLIGERQLEEFEVAPAAQEGNETQIFYEVDEQESNVFEREEELARIKGAFESRAIVVISGAEKIGKTLLMQKFALSLLNIQSQVSCVWLNGQTKQTLQNSMEGLLTELISKNLITKEINNYSSLKITAAFTSIYSVLTTNKRRLVLMIDNLSSGVAPDIKDLLNYFKKRPVPKPFTVVTTTDQNVFGSQIGETIKLQ